METLRFSGVLRKHSSSPQSHVSKSSLTGRTALDQPRAETGSSEVQYAATGGSFPRPALGDTGIRECRMDYRYEAVTPGNIPGKLEDIMRVILCICVTFSIVQNIFLHII